MGWSERAGWLWWPVVIAGVLVVSAFLLSRGLANLNQVQDELRLVRQSIQRLERHNRALYRAVLRLRTDSQALERSVRRDMGLVRADEVVYQDPTVAAVILGKPGDKE
jgi:cell division protein FtsB